MAQPCSRSGTGPTGVQTGNTNVIRMARCAAAAEALSTPEKVTATPRANIVATASPGCGATAVPSAISPAPIPPRVR